MTAKTTAATRTAREDKGLDGRYGKIGISAVAAALNYPSDAKNPAYAPKPVDPREDKWLQDMLQEEMAA